MKREYKDGDYHSSAVKNENMKIEEMVKS